MHMTALRLTLLAIAAGGAADALAQGMPTTQPKLLAIYREELKTGRAGDHAKWEALWPAAFEKAGAKFNYIALSSITGPSEVWYLTPLADHAALGDMMAMEADPALAPELERLAKGDAEFVERVTQMHAVAQPDLSHGTFPDMSKVRFYEITTFRVKPGHAAAFIAATKAYKAAAGRSDPSAAWRTYDVVAGAPGGTYLVFSSVGSFAEFDKMMAGGESTWKGMTPEETAALDRFMKDGVSSTVTQRYRVSPSMSYVDAATRAKDPAFWGAKP
jgi:hypothetical protein